MKSSVVTVACAAGLLLVAHDLRAQQPPSPAQAQQLLQQTPALADTLRRRILRSGLTPEQIRARLQASGYPANLLDAYLGGAGGQITPAQPGVGELAAVQALGLPPIALPGGYLPLDTGMISLRVTSAKPSSVFGVDAFRRTTTQFLPLLSGPVPPDYKLGPVFTALYVAGGVTERANMRGIEIQRAGKTVATLDLYDYLLRGNTRNDVRLETGDVVFVPVHGTRAEISGAVVRPYVYELKPSETLVDLVQTAGGFRRNGELRPICVHINPPAS